MSQPSESPGRDPSQEPQAISVVPANHTLEVTTWETICRTEAYQGRWVALENCEYDSHTGQATSGSVVDADEDLVELCERLKKSSQTNCEVLYCEHAA